MSVSINYFKENLKKFDHDNLISFLFDIVLRVDIAEVVDFEEDVQYHLNEKVYIKDFKGKHHIYKCKVENSTIGEIKDEEWVDLIQSFRKPIVSDETVVASLDIRQEVLEATVDGQVEFTLKTAGVGEDEYNIVIFHSELGRLARIDFQVSGQNIILNEEYKVNKGGKLVVDLYGKM